MAARRLIIVLIVLFVASIVAAALAPERQGSLTDEETTTTATDATTTTDRTGTDADGPGTGADPSGRIALRLDASREDPPTAKALVGDQLELQVRSDQFIQLEIPAFGVTDNASPNAPARFSLLLRDAGEIPILAARTGHTVARLVVDPGDGPERGKSTGEERPEPDSTDSER